jgi:hypothetical protein
MKNKVERLIFIVQYVVKKKKKKIKKTLTFDFQFNWEWSMGLVGRI